MAGHAHGQYFVKSGRVSRVKVQKNIWKDGLPTVSYPKNSHFAVI